MPLLTPHSAIDRFGFDLEPWRNFQYAVSDESYSKWLLVSIFVAIPLGLELVLDYPKIFESYEERENWLATLLLILTFVVPNSILYCLIYYCPAVLIKNEVLLTRFAFVRIQQQFYTFAMLAMMFGRRIEYARNTKYTFLNFSVEKRTVTVLSLFMFGKAFDLLGDAFNKSLSRVGYVVNTLAVVALLLLLIRMLYMQVYQYVKRGKFPTHYHLSDCMLCSTNILFVVFSFIVQAYATANPPHHEEQAKAIVKCEIFLQIGLACFIQIISGRKNKLLAEIKHEKLETRLNLIRYVSHEMRTPLNTAFMGLTLVTNDLKVWRRKVRSEEHREQDLQAMREIMASMSDAASPRSVNGGRDQPPSPLHRSLLVRSFKTSAVGLSNDVQHTEPTSTDPVVSLARTESPYRSIDLNQPWDKPMHDDSKSDADDRKKGSETNISGMLTPSTQIDSRAISEALDTLTQVNDSCQVALSTLDDLLTFDKIDEQKLVVEMQDISPWSFVCAAAKPFSINAKQTHVHFAVKLHDRESGWARRHMIRGDPFKLSQVLRNLISNALKFTPAEGNVEVRVQRDPDFNNKDIVRISVTDTGAGISPQNQKKLFGQYVQFNAGALQQGKGSGLGLWISKSIVEMHEGQIGVISEGEGCGSMFYVDLPLFRRSIVTSTGDPASHSSRGRSFGSSASIRNLYERPPSDEAGVVSASSAAVSAAAPASWDSELNPTIPAMSLSVRKAADNIILDTDQSVPSNRVIKQKKMRKSFLNSSWEWRIGKSQLEPEFPVDNINNEAHAHSTVWDRVWTLLGYRYWWGAPADHCRMVQDDANSLVSDLNTVPGVGGDDGSSNNSLSKTKRAESRIFLDYPVRLWINKRCNNANLGAANSQSSLLPDQIIEGYERQLVVDDQDNAVVKTESDEMRLRNEYYDPTEHAVFDYSDSYLSMIPEELDYSMKVVNMDDQDSLVRLNSPSLEEVPFETKPNPRVLRKNSSTFSLLKGRTSNAHTIRQDSSGRVQPSALRPDSQTSSESDFRVFSSISPSKLLNPPLRPMSGTLDDYGLQVAPSQSVSSVEEIERGEHVNSTAAVPLRLRHDSCDSLQSDDSNVAVRYNSPKYSTQQIQSSNNASNHKINSPPNLTINTNSSFSSLPAQLQTPLSRQFTAPLLPAQSDRTIRLHEHPALNREAFNRHDSEVRNRWQQGLKILLVDDVLSNRKLCSKLLTSHGHVVLDAHDGQHGLEVWQEHQRLYGSMSGSSDNNANCGDAASINTPPYHLPSSNIATQPREQEQVQVQRSGRHGQFTTSSFNSNGNGSAALTDRPFDLILLDDNMPRLSGFQTAQALRKLGYKGLIIGVTGDVHEEAVQRFLSHGADHVLSKPLDIEKLRTNVLRLS
eukprot:gene3829-4180_t